MFPPSFTPPALKSAPAVFTVTRLNQTVRMLLEQDLGLVWLSAEISNLSRPSSGHWYFSLKDLGAQVRCAMFKGQNRRVSFVPSDGMQVLVQARVSLYEPRGDYQLLVEQMQPAGEGLLALRFEELKRRLAAQGLFAQERKRALPRAPRAVGLITSASGAALFDMLNVLGRRAPDLPIYIYPASVQGAAASGQLIAALARANARAEVDVLILGRGGGAAEDLWCFNDEVLAKAIASSRLPVVSAVGHEVDVTIADFVADLRAPTPSAAAELVVPDQGARQAALAQLAQRLWHRMRQQQQAAGLRLQQRLARLQAADPKRQLAHQRQQLDEGYARLQGALRLRQQREEKVLAALALRLAQHSPALRLTQARSQWARLSERLPRALAQVLATRRHQLQLCSTHLHNLSPLATLSRGYSITRTAQGAVVTASTQVAVGQDLTLDLAQGALGVRVVEIKS
ncbi:MAG: exodeoxyribonuclease VII large subunit [Aeromonas sp.]